MVAVYTESITPLDRSCFLKRDETSHSLWSFADRDTHAAEFSLDRSSFPSGRQMDLNIYIYIYIARIIKTRNVCSFTVKLVNYGKPYYGSIPRDLDTINPGFLLCFFLVPDRIRFFYSVINIFYGIGEGSWYKIIWKNRYLRSFDDVWRCLRQFH